MRYVTTGERISYDRGKQEQTQTLILRLLQRRVGKLSLLLRSHIQSLTVSELEELGEALLDFK
ncbi:MAG: DUF4351 domain-containing protein [Brasilonema angustatum HA4187-MV1]|jgi:hypothetical protein|nr:DUF4351 domain-containing protein [Brasilonema angustatum HA4187-MV1]